MAMRTKAMPLLLALAVCYMVASWTATSFTTGFAASPAAELSKKKAALQAAARAGNTEAVAGLLTEATGVDAQLIDDIDGGDLAGYDALIVGAPTWNTDADEMRSGTAWDDNLDTIRGLDLKGKPVAVFGCGDSGSYGDNFCDAIEEVHAAFAAAGAKMIGQVDASGYSHSASKSDAGGKFLGLPCDQDNEADMSEDRVKSWVAQLKSEGMSF